MTAFASPPSGAVVAAGRGAAPATSRRRPTMCNAAPGAPAPAAAPAAAVPPAAAAALPTEAPPGMTEAWFLAARRLAAATPGAGFAAADAALTRADGDEFEALGLLTLAARSDEMVGREAVVEAARSAGDSKRVSALKEAELRRIATGSARNYFGGFVEVAGQHVDSGYVDEEADVMARAGNRFKKWFGGSGGDEK